jgi:hypothetical protein
LIEFLEMKMNIDIHHSMYDVDDKIKKDEGGEEVC